MEVLHTYQRERKGIAEVHAEVVIVFRGHPDLISEFSVFLPTSHAESYEKRLRCMQLMQRWRAVARVAGKLVLLHRRASERTYAPGGTGFAECRERFEASADRL